MEVIYLYYKTFSFIFSYSKIISECSVQSIDLQNITESRSIRCETITSASQTV